MQVSDLSGAHLDYWTARAEGFTEAKIIRHQREDRLLCVVSTWPAILAYIPSTDWSIAGPIIEREEIELYVYHHRKFSEDGKTHWAAHYFFKENEDHEDWHEQFGETSLIASMRAYIVSRFGEEVPDVEISDE